MNGNVVFFVYTLCILVCTRAKPHVEAKSREETGHFADDPERHDVQFDHNAFLGSDKAKEFSKLTPEQSKEKLKEIILKIDKDHDGKITFREMSDWIAHIAKVSQVQVTEKRWAEANPDGKDPLSWQEYSERSYGREEDRLKDDDNGKQYQKTLRLDKRRWDAADKNADGALSKEEFIDFLNPEDKPHMRDAIIQELLESVDTDGNRKVSEEEYLDDLARAYQTPLLPGQPEPDWAEREREQFRKYRDLDQNGFLDHDEVGEWIMPSNYDPVEAETHHLFYHADSDKDDSLTEQEILDKQELFVSSQATNYGTVFEHRQGL